MFELVEKKPHLNGNVNINKRELNDVIAHVQGIMSLMLQYSTVLFKLARAHFNVKAELQIVKPYILKFRWLHTDTQVVIVTAGCTELRPSLITASAGREHLDLEETVQG